MFIEVLIPFASVAVTAAIGITAYKLSLRNQRLVEEATLTAKAEARVDKADGLFDDARALKDDYKEAYEALREEVHALRIEVEALRDELHSQTRWKKVATLAFHAWKELTDSTPFWWPKDEADPEKR